MGAARRDKVSPKKTHSANPLWDYRMMLPVENDRSSGAAPMHRGAEARETLERIRPLIRVAAYHEAREDLEHGGKS